MATKSKTKRAAAKAKPARQANSKIVRRRTAKPTFDDIQVGDDGCTDKQRAFTEFYLGVAHFNGTEAAKRAGYSGNRVTLASVGYENLRKPQIAKIVQTRMRELAMGPDEVLALLTEQARNEASKYVRVRKGQPGVDVAAMIRDGKQHLIKGITYTRTGQVVVEIYDAQAAQVHIGRHHGLFKDVVEIEEPITIKMDR
jgi:phage terminase small subunit